MTTCLPPAPARTYAEHLAWRGPLPPTDPSGWWAALHEVTLLGRGGAGFPLARKLDAVGEAVARTGRAPVVVANGVEGDYESIVDDRRLADDLDGRVQQANEQLERWETVKRYAVLPREF